MPGLPPPHPDELEQLLGFLAQERYVVRLTAFGMTDEQARMAPSVSPADRWRPDQAPGRSPGVLDGHLGRTASAC